MLVASKARLAQAMTNNSHTYDNRSFAGCRLVGHRRECVIKTMCGNEKPDMMIYTLVLAAGSGRITRGKQPGQEARVRRRRHVQEADAG